MNEDDNLKLKLDFFLILKMVVCSRIERPALHPFYKGS